MSNNTQIFEFPNGLTLIVEEMGTVKSVAFTVVVPSGILQDEPDRIGASLILTELTSKGAGSWDSRGIVDAFDSIGARHAESAGNFSSSYSGALLAENLDQALPLVAAMIREPHFPEDEIDSIKSLLNQDISSLYDNPSRWVLHELGKLYYPDPYSRPSIGAAADIKATTLSDIKALWKKAYTPKGAIISIAGNVKADKVKALIEKLFGDWSGEECPLPALNDLSPRKMHHIKTESAQLQIALAYPSAKFGDEHYYAARVASDILSGGMFGRLFIEVREKRGLCYSVYSSVSSTALTGVSLCYAGTTTERAQETLDVMLEVLAGVKGNVVQEELDRSKANIKASLIMSEESSASRAGSNASDWWWLKRVRGLDEIKKAVNSVSFDDLDGYFTKFPCINPMVATLGAKELVLK